MIDLIINRTTAKAVFAGVAGMVVQSSAACPLRQHASDNTNDWQ